MKVSSLARDMGKNSPVELDLFRIELKEVEKKKLDFFFQFS